MVKAKRKESHKSAKPAKRPEIKAPSGSKVIRWQAPDYYTFERSPYWSLGVGVIAIVLSLILIYTENYFPVIIIILAVIVTFQVAHEHPKTQDFALDEGGILSRNNFIPHDEIKSFWIAKHGTKSILYFEPINRAKATIVIPLGNQNPTEVRNFLLQSLPEKLEYGEMLSEKLMRIFRL